MSWLDVVVPFGFIVVVGMLINGLSTIINTLQAIDSTLTRLAAQLETSNNTSREIAEELARLRQAQEPEDRSWDIHGVGMAGENEP